DHRLAQVHALGHAEAKTLSAMQRYIAIDVVLKAEHLRAGQKAITYFDTGSSAALRRNVASLSGNWSPFVDFTSRRTRCVPSAKACRNAAMIASGFLRETKLLKS